MGKLDGTLFGLPGGDLRFSIGAGVVDEDYRGIRPVTQIQSASTLGRRSPYAFGEVFAPIVGPAQKIPLLNRLELSLAVRYTDYQDRSSPALARDFGNSTDPKIGLLWSPADGLNLRATYGTSFRAPALTQLDSTATGNFLLPAILGGSPGLVLNLGPYAAPDLGPETAETFTGGFDVAVPALKGFRLSATYYNIDYQGRIAIAPAGSIDVFGFPQLVPELIYKPPSAAFIADQLTGAPLLFNATAIDLADPVAAAQALFVEPNFWIFDTRYKNLALSRQDGIDMSASQSLRTDWGDLNLAANVTRILLDRQQASATSTVMTGVGIPARPPHWRGRLSASLSQRDFNATLGANYVDSYVNSWAPGAPPVENWTTIDLTLNRSFQTGLLEGLRISLGIQNLFDRDPPALNMGTGNAIVSPVGFDPVNANPMGRLYALSLAKTW
jgi:outer membrane receptor protein involved in Fe transport